jgi:hypothetical protein
MSIGLNVTMQCKQYTLNSKSLTNLQLAEKGRKILIPLANVGKHRERMAPWKHDESRLFPLLERVGIFNTASQNAPN